MIDGESPDWYHDALALAQIHTLIPTVGREVANFLNAASKGLHEALRAQLPEGAVGSLAPPAALRVLPRRERGSGPVFLRTIAGTNGTAARTAFASERRRPASATGRKKFSAR